MYQIHYLQYAALYWTVRNMARSTGQSNFAGENRQCIKHKEFSSDLIYELDQDLASFPLNSSEDFDELERKLEDPSAQKHLV